ncbi:hypothetical protein Tco_0451107 [Tanacetum coccineum]
MAPVTPPRAASLTRPDTPPLPSSIPASLPIDPMMLHDYQTTTTDPTPWIPLTLIDVAKIEVLELRYGEDNYPREQVDALRVKVDRLHRSVEAMSQLPLSDSSDRVATTITKHEENRANAAGAARPARAARLTRAGVAGLIGARAGTARPAGGVTRGNVAPEIHGYTYKSFLNYNLYTFSGIKGKVGLSRWFEKLELDFCISGCADESRVKVATYILQVSCNVPYNGYPEYKKIELYIWGLLEKIQGNVPFSKPATTHEAIRITHNLMDQKVRAKVARGSDGNKRK